MSDYHEKKFDAGKRRWNLFPFQSAEEIVKILEFGAEKYSPNSWQELPNAEERYFEACMRHMVAVQKGEHIDPESGMPHLAHAGCNILFLLHFFQEKLNDSKSEEARPDIRTGVHECRCSGTGSACGGRHVHSTIQHETSEDWDSGGDTRGVRGSD